jgi:predicted RNase H-like HicB family nuclease
MRGRGTYRIVYDRDAESGWWLARAADVAGCHTQARSLAEARRRIREALDLFVDDAAEATLTDDLRVPTKIQQAVRAYRRLRKRADAEEAKAAVAARSAVEALQGASLSVRDAAAVLGVSHQRVHQLKSGSTRRGIARDRSRSRR